MQESRDIKSRTIELAAWLVGFAWFTIIIPASIIIFLDPGDRIDAAATLALTPVAEYLSVAFGIGFGLNPFIAFLLTVLPCIGYVFFMIGVLGFFSESSARVKRFLAKVPAKIEKYPRFKKYGIASNFVFIILLGVYIAPGVSLILGWSRVRSVLFMAAGICFITLLIGLFTEVILEVFF